MASFSIPITQINLHSKGALVILRSMSVVQTCIAIVQEPWLVKDVIRGLGNCSKVLKANTTNKIRTCVITKGVDATLLPQLSCGDLTAVQLTLMLASGIHRDMITRSAYVPYDSEHLTPQEEMKKLVAYASDFSVVVM